VTSTIIRQIGFAAVALAASLATTSAVAEDVRWRMPMAYNSNLPGLGTTAVWVAEKLEAASGGTIRVRTSEPGKLVPTFEILDAVSDGKLPVGYTWIGYDQGKVPALPLFASVPFGLKPWAFAGWYYFGDGHEMLQEVYAHSGYNVYAQLCGMTGPETAGWYREPITSLDDYDGMKIRFAGLGGKIIERLGASVTVMPGGDLFPALEKGTIDATEYGSPVVDESLGFDQLLRNNLYPGWHQPFTAQHLLINLDVWNSLTDQQKAIVETTCTAAAFRGLAEGEFRNPPVLARLEAEGVNIGVIPDDILMELKRIADEVLAEEAAADEDFRLVLESQRAFQELYRLWDQRAYLPAEVN